MDMRTLETILLAHPDATKVCLKCNSPFTGKAASCADCKCKLTPLSEVAKGFGADLKRLRALVQSHSNLVAPETGPNSVLPSLANGGYQLLRINYWIFSALMFIVYVGTVIDFLHKFVGFLAYGLWIIVAPVMLPVALILPWFDAWVSNAPHVNGRIFLIWLLWIISTPVLLGYTALTAKIRGEK